LVAEEVLDLATHEQQLETPAAYRPAACPRCQSKLHLHGLRVRLLLGQPQRYTEVVRFRCADRERCGAAWQVLPAFLARWLWRSWSVVANTLARPEHTLVPARTARRWRARLDSDAGLLVAVLLGATGAALARTVVAAAGWRVRRRELVDHYRRMRGCVEGVALAQLAGWVHRLVPGIRVM